MNTKAEILALLEGRSEEGLAKVYEFIKDMDERELIESLNLPTLTSPKTLTNALLKHGRCLQT